MPRGSLVVQCLRIRVTAGVVDLIPGQRIKIPHARGIYTRAPHHWSCTPRLESRCAAMRIPNGTAETLSRQINNFLFECVSSLLSLGPTFCPTVSCSQEAYVVSPSKAARVAEEAACGSSLLGSQSTSWPWSWPDIQLALPYGCFGRVAPCSGLTVKHFIDVGAGVIDEKHRGNVGVVLLFWLRKVWSQKGW